MSEEWKEEIIEARDDDAREMRRLAAAERRAGKSDRMDSKVASKYADSEAKSAEKADKKSKGKHIHGMADSVEVDGDLVEKKDDSYLETNMNQRRKNNEKAVEDMKKTKAHADMVKAAGKHFEETDLEEKKGLWDNIHAKRARGEKPAKPGEKGYPKTLNVEELDQIIEGIRQARKNVGASKCWTGKKLGNPPTKMKGGKEVPNCEEFSIQERALDAAEKGEKERLVKGMKKSASDFKERYGKRAQSVMYATATARAKEHMDTSKSDRRYGVER